MGRQNRYDAQNELKPLYYPLKDTSHDPSAENIHISENRVGGSDRWDGAIDNMMLIMS